MLPDKQQLAPDERFVKAPEFYKRLGVSKSKFYQSVRDGKLPQPIKISPRNAVWKSSVVNEVLDSVADGSLKF